MRQAKLKAIVSNGSYKFHLAPLASELSKRDHLAAFLTAGYPGAAIRKFAYFFSGNASLQRLVDRAEDIPDSQVHALGVLELLFKSADILIRKHSITLQQHIHCFAFRLYAASAGYFLKRTPTDIYHYRNCYGGSSVFLAQKLGIATICDHSIANPRLIGWLIDHRGQFPDLSQYAALREQMLPLYRAMEDDLQHGDTILVNSDFVRESLVRYGYPPERVKVVYLGVDDAFISALDSACEKKVNDSTRLLFAGGWQFRKGIMDLIEALSDLDRPWSLEIAGGADPEVLLDKRMQSFMADERVTWYGTIPRQDLSALMARNKIFIFPSYCEGSARVIFEAMAAGMFIITTENAGSIVKNGVNGIIVPPGDIKALMVAIVSAFENEAWVDSVGKGNADLVREKYLQRDYADRVLLVYNDILGISLN
ncbi:glycosyltransferase [Perlucidibaca aquatica]|uniref:glycosyltransferase n=1 Tax=Perlucidibaca aquatica TaxID=1852776 RepID=UPI0009EF5D3B|nr:glycosyltransferase [Perlucidibaca aquatica]